jgi:hypothetical protein
MAFRTFKFLQSLLQVAPENEVFCIFLQNSGLQTDRQDVIDNKNISENLKLKMLHF